MKSNMKDSDLPDVLRLLRTHTFNEVAKLYGYVTTEHNGGTGIRNFVRKHGYDPRLFAKPQAKPTQKSYNIGAVKMEEDYPPPKLIAVYYDDAYRAWVQRYEARSALI